MSSLSNKQTKYDEKKTLLPITLIVIVLVDFQFVIIFI